MRGNRADCRRLGRACRDKVGGRQRTGGCEMVRGYTKTRSDWAIYMEGVLEEQISA